MENVKTHDNVYQQSIQEVWDVELMPTIERWSDTALQTPFNQSHFDKYDSLMDAYYSAVYYAYGEVNNDGRHGWQVWIQEAI